MMFRTMIMMGVVLAVTPKMIGQCDLIRSQDEARQAAGMAAVAHTADLDALCDKIADALHNDNLRTRVK